MRKLTFNQIQDIADYFNRIMFVQQNEKMDLKKLCMLTSSIGGKARLVDANKKDESTAFVLATFIGYMYIYAKTH